eukprot:scaffold86082_cov28-Tisochrysis_lutea.AAC.3
MVLGRTSSSTGRCPMSSSPPESHGMYMPLAGTTSSECERAIVRRSRASSAASVSACAAAASAARAAAASCERTTRLRSVIAANDEISISSKSSREPRKPPAHWRAAPISKLDAASPTK